MKRICGFIHTCQNCSNIVREDVPKEAVGAISNIFMCVNCNQQMVRETVFGEALMEMIE